MVRRAKSKTFQDLIVWRKAHEFVLRVYKITQSFPQNELYGLTSQFRCAAVSIPANIAEGIKKACKADPVYEYCPGIIRRMSILCNFVEGFRVYKTKRLVFAVRRGT
jgi:hypothetical protein